MALLPYLDPEGHFATVLPRGPIAASLGFAWFDIESGDPVAASEGRAAVDRRSSTICSTPRAPNAA